MIDEEQEALIKRLSIGKTVTDDEWNKHKILSVRRNDPGDGDRCQRIDKDGRFRYNREAVGPSVNKGRYVVFIIRNIVVLLRGVAQFG